MSHLSYAQRYTIEVLLQSGESKTAIAAKLKVHKSVIYREISRNCDLRNLVYNASLAQRKYEDRIKQKPKYIKVDEALKILIRTLLWEDYSPEQIAGVLKKEGIKTLSHESIYRLIWQDKRQKGVLPHPFKK